MASLPTTLTVLEKSQVSPPPATVGDRVLPLIFFDFLWLKLPPIRYLFSYELSISKSQSIDSVIPNLKHSLSITLQHFYPFAGNLIIFPTAKQKPEIRYVEGDSVEVTFAESNLDFSELTGNHPRECEKFYHLSPPLGKADHKTLDCIKIPVFSVQVTVFPNHGISIGITNHHSLCDASTLFHFMKAWTSIARFGTDELFLATGTLPFYDRVIDDPKLDERYLKFAKVESTFNKEYQPPSMSGPTDKVRVTLTLTRTMLDGLKKTVSTHLPSLAYVSSFTVTCGYIWSCIAKLRTKEERQVFRFIIDCRARLDPPVPSTYFGNCLGGSEAIGKASLLAGKDGFITAAKLLGESLHKTLNETGGVVKDIESSRDRFLDGVPTTFIGVSGTPKLKFYEIDFGFGKPKKIETISIDRGMVISLDACKESSQGVEIGISLSPNEMEAFIRAFDDGLKEFS